MDKLCATCTYWTGDRKKGGSGQCRRLPVAVAGIIPQRDLVGNTVPGVISAWPSCNSTEWCGEHKVEIVL